MLLINFFDTDYISALIPVKTFCPERIIFLSDYTNHRSQGPVFLKDTIARFYDKHNPPELEFFGVDADDLHAIEDTLRELIGKNKNEDILLNITGGSVQMGIAAFGASFRFANVSPICVDRGSNVIMNVLTQETIAELAHITLDDYISVIGAERRGNSKSVPPENMFDAVKEVSEMIFAHEETWHALCDYLVRYTRSYDIGSPFHLPKTAKYNRKSFSIRFMMDKIAECGFVRKVNDSLYAYVSGQYKSYLMTYGSWLELYVYIHAIKYFDDVSVGVQVDWTKHDYFQTLDNEIDVLAMKNSEPYFISCKMTEPTIQNLYEIGYVATHIKGIYAHPILATTYPVRQRKKGPSELLERVRKLHIGLIEAEDFKTKSVKNVFKDATVK